MISKCRNIFNRLKGKAPVTGRIVYLGNGAAGILPDVLREHPQIRCRKPEAGALSPSLEQDVGGADADCRLPSLFFHEEGAFTGYHARAKLDGNWKWYGEDGNWYSSSELAADPLRRKRLLTPDGGGIRDCFCGSGTVYLVAQWRSHKTGGNMDAGYPVFCHTLMAHALGGIDGKCYTNTREALERSYAGGYRYFEADVALTEDGHLCLSHGWDEKSCRTTGMAYQPEFEHMTWELFRKQRIFGMHVMDVRELRAFMEAHPDTYFEIDSHRTNAAEKIRALLEAFSYDEALLGRLLIQAESRKIFKEIDAVYHFRNYQLILGKEWLEKLEEGISFALEKGIVTIAMRQALFDRVTVRTLREAGLNVMAYTIKEDRKRSRELLAMGVNTICTDFVKPEDISGNPVAAEQI